jgi:hypothetical protein
MWEEWNGAYIYSNGKKISIPQQLKTEVSDVKKNVLFDVRWTCSIVNGRL